MRAYGFFLAVYVCVWTVFFALMHGMDRAWPRAIAPMDLLLLSLATYRLTQVLTEEKVAACLRSPFCEVKRVRQQDGTVKEEEVPRGTGLRHVAGELILCPWCTGIWIATLSTFAFVLAPGAARIVLTVFAVAAAGLIFQILAKLMDQTRHTLPELADATPSQRPEEPAEKPHLRAA